MQLLSIRLPQELLDQLDEMIKEGVIISRGEGVRLAIREYYRKHFEQQVEDPYVR